MSQNIICQEGPISKTNELVVRGTVVPVRLEQLEQPQTPVELHMGNTPIYDQVIMDLFGGSLRQLPMWEVVDIER